MDPAAPSELAELEVTAMVHGGEGFGRLPDGRVAFVEGALPGERVRIFAPGGGRFVRQALAELPASPGSDRVLAPPCPHFGLWPERGQRPEAHCGGCRWQHAAYPAQLRYKADIVRDCLTRIGGLKGPAVAACLGMGEPWGYRNHLRVRVSEGGGPALVALDGASLVPIGTCPIAHPLVMELLDCLDLELAPGTEVGLRAGLGTGDRLIAIHAPAEAVGDIDVELDLSVVLIDPDTGEVQVAAGRPYLVERLGGRAFMVPAESFFQVNTAMAERLVEVVAGLIPSGADRLVDLYSGVGTFAILLADRFREVIAVEAFDASVAAAIDNAAGLEHVSLVHAEADEGLAWALAEAPDAAGDVILLDPPRSGLDGRTLGLLASCAALRIIYVSCEPSTLARDARRLAEAGWELLACQPLDMFPQTYHVETVSAFARRPAGEDQVAP